MADYNRSGRIEVYHMIEDANISITGNNESNRTDKIPQVLADFHACVSKLTELQGTGKSFQELSPRDQAEAFIAAASVNHIINKVEDSLVARNKVSHQEVIERCGVTDLYEQTLEHFDPVAHPDAVRENPYIEDRALERIDHFYTDYNHAENDTIGVENYSCYLLPGEENPVDPDDPFRTETNPDYRSFLMDSNESKLESYRAYTGEAAADRVDKPEAEDHMEREQPAPEPPQDKDQPAGPVSREDAAPKTDPEIYRFLTSAVRFPLEILNSPEASAYVSGARGNKGLVEFEAAKSGLISAVREGDMDGVTRCAHAIEHQLDLCEKKTGMPLEITSLRSDRIDRLADLGERAFTGSDGKLIRLNQTDPWRAWAVLKFDIGVLTTGKEDWEARYHTEKPSAAGAAGRCVAGFLGLMVSLSGPGIFSAYSSAVFKGLLDYADRIEKGPERDIERNHKPDAAPVSIEAVAKYSAMEITNLLERPDAPEIAMLRDALGEDRFSIFREEVREYLSTNDSSHWDKAQQILESAAGRQPGDVEKRNTDTEAGQPAGHVSRGDPEVSADHGKYIQRLRDIDAHQNRHGEYTSVFSFDSNGNEYKSSGMRMLDPRDTLESFRFMTSVVGAFSHGGKMDFQLPGRDMHEGKAVGILDVFMSVNQFLHTDIGYTVIKYAFEHAKDSFVDIRAADTRDLFEKIISSIENGPEGSPPDPVGKEDVHPEPPPPPDSAPPAPGEKDSRRDSADTDDLIAASEEDAEAKPPEDTPRGEPAEPAGREEAASAGHDTEASPSAPESVPEPQATEPAAAPPAEPAESQAPPDAEVAGEPQAEAVPAGEPAGYTQVSAEAKDAVAAYLDPAGGSTQTYEEIFESLMEKYPDVDYNHIDFAMDTAEVFAGNVESGIVYGEDTARGLFDNMYEVIMNNEPVNDGFSKSDLYDMTFREIIADTGEPVCGEDMFIIRESGEEFSRAPGEPADPDTLDVSGTAPLGEAGDISAPAAEVSLEIQSDTETVPGVGESAPNDLTAYYASAVENAGAVEAEDQLPAPDAVLEVPEAKHPDSLTDLPVPPDPVSAPEEPKVPEIEKPADGEIPAADESIPDTEVQLSEGAAEAVAGSDLEGAVAEETEAEEIAAALL